jgi:preprotein translocase subunit Sec61beta
LKVAFVGQAMAKQTKGPGIQSAAGLIRYYDAEETSSVKIPPMLVIIFGALVGIGTILMRVFWEF